ncbi:MAG: UDP-N-acetylmuramate dehydrogenase [Acidobacteria bacterium]|nr:UDP-N-acetylmuramate dehydrogenase [Acidobacteriota bacterium]
MHFKEKLKENVLLKPYTTLGIGGLASYFVDADREEIIFEAIKWANKEEKELFVLGGGSNLVVADSGFSGLVLHINTRAIESNYKDDKVFVTLASGENWDDFVALAVKNNWQGIECLSGIPGKVGATPIQNVGAYGQEVKDTITEVQAYDRKLEKLVSFSNQECDFSYRQSFFKSQAKDRYVILKVTYSLSLNTPPRLNYPELKKYVLENISSTPTLLDIHESVLRLRRSKSMVIDAQDPNSRSVGSFFMNPIIEEKKLNLIKEKLLKEGVNDNIPEFAAREGMVKLSAAWLIEKAGFKKGYQKGRVAISSKHALALINKENGTAKEICLLAEEIQEKVKEKFDIWLEPEAIYIGFNK